MQDQDKNKAMMVLENQALERASKYSFRAPNLLREESAIISSWKRNITIKQIATLLPDEVRNETDNPHRYFTIVLIKEIAKILINIFLEIEPQKKTARNDIELMAKKVSEDMFTNFHYFNLDDIRMCLKKGISGELTAKLGNIYMGYCDLRAELIYKWIREYKSIRDKAISKQMKAEIALEEQDRESKILQRMHLSFISRIASEYHEFVKTGVYSAFYSTDIGNSIYNYFKEIIQSTIDEKTRLKQWRNGRVNVIKKYSDAKDKLSANFENNTLNDAFLESAKSSPERYDKNIKNWVELSENNHLIFQEIIEETKRIVLRIFFYNLKDENKSIENLIKTIEKT